MDVEQTMQFILEQQARHEAAVLKFDEQIASLTDLVGRLPQAEIRLVERMDNLAGRMDNLAEQTRGQEGRLQALEKSATSLFTRLDRFIKGMEGDGRKHQ
jgi:chromosome segregation ATPase